MTQQIPRTQQNTPNQPPAQVAATTPQPVRKTVLIVEDESAMAKVLMLKLNKAGIAVQIAENGEFAKVLLQKQRFDLIITDIMMPHVDGFTLLTELQQLGNQTPIIVASNLSQREDIERAKSLGASSYFAKADTPVNTLTNYALQILSGHKPSGGGLMTNTPQQKPTQVPTTQTNIPSQ